MMMSRRPISQFICYFKPNSCLLKCRPCTSIIIRTYAIPAPSTRRARAREDGRSSGIHSINKHDFLPSLTLLRSTGTTGATTVDADHILRFLTAYVDLGPDASPSRVERLCGEQNIPTSDLPHIAVTLLRSTRSPHHALAKHILLTSSMLAISEATYFLVSEGLKRDRLSQPQLQPAVDQLSRLASAGTDFRASILWGQVLLSRGQERQAMKVFQKVVNEDAKTNQTTEKEESSKSPFHISKSKAYALLASYNLKNNNISFAYTLSKHAAEKYDDVEAWLCLAKSIPGDSDEKEKYLTHAAAKGSLEAANELGEFFLRRSKGDLYTDEKRGEGKRKNNLRDRMWAKEWFSLGILEGVPRGQEEVMRLLG